MLSQAALQVAQEFTLFLNQSRGSKINSDKIDGGKGKSQTSIYLLTKRTIHQNKLSSHNRKHISLRAGDILRNKINSTIARKKNTKE